MTEEYAPSIISLNELGTIIPPKIVQKLLYSYTVFHQNGTNSHGGVILAIDKNLKAIPLNIDEQNIVAAMIHPKEKPLVIASIYSPPTEPLPLRTMSSLIAVSKNIILAGDLNAKHADWGCSQTNSKGRQLAEWLRMNDLEVLNVGMKTSLRSDTTIDLIISSNTSGASSTKSLPFTGSDHLPVFAEFPDIDVNDDYVLVPKTYWDVYTAVLDV
jgi:endonuclease/exonuclease/phosphatase (EEP) superfamily protein YafD